MASNTAANLVKLGLLGPDLGEAEGVQPKRATRTQPAHPQCVLKGGAEGGIRTHDRRFTKPLLYP